MRITFLGHAGLSIETACGTILCDPWFNAAFHASWFPFPRNDAIRPEDIGSPDYLYVSHLHHDHFDPEFLSKHVDHGATVLLPDYPTEHLRRALEDIGFTRFVRTRNREPLDLDGLEIMINALVTPTDGPIGDSGLAVGDGSARVFNQNDSRPVDMDALSAFGPYDGHFLQFSGAIWYPMVYRFPERTKRGLARAKRANQFARAVRYIRDLGASHVFPSAGPPCFLDDDLFHLNDLDGDDSNIFPDQTVFLDHMRSQGLRNGQLVIPGTLLSIEGGNLRVEHPLSDSEIRAIFEDKRAYLGSYRQDRHRVLEETRRSWPTGELDLARTLKEWWEPLLDEADSTCAGVNGRVLLDVGDDAIVIDFLDRRVDRWKGEECRFRFRFERGPVELCTVRHDEDWVNSLFLSCRFEAERDGHYNEYVYTFFKSLSPERMAYVEGYYSQRPPLHEMWECNGYLIQRRCPHLEGDLSRFGRVDDGILTCQLHGWQFDLATGRCLTADDRRLLTRPVDFDDSPDAGPTGS